MAAIGSLVLPRAWTRRRARQRSEKYRAWLGEPSAPNDGEWGVLEGILDADATFEVAGAEAVAASLLLATEKEEPIATRRLQGSGLRLVTDDGPVAIEGEVEVVAGGEQRWPGRPRSIGGLDALLPGEPKRVGDKEVGLCVIRPGARVRMAAKLVRVVEPHPEPGGYRQTPGHWVAVDELPASPVRVAAMPMRVRGPHWTVQVWSLLLAALGSLLVFSAGGVLAFAFGSELALATPWHREMALASLSHRWAKEVESPAASPAQIERHVALARMQGRQRAAIWPLLRGGHVEVAESLASTQDDASLRDVADVWMSKGEFERASRTYLRIEERLRAETPSIDAFVIRSDHLVAHILAGAFDRAANGLRLAVDIDDRLGDEPQSDGARVQRKKQRCIIAYLDHLTGASGRGDLDELESHLDSPFCTFVSALRQPPAVRAETLLACDGCRSVGGMRDAVLLLIYEGLGCADGGGDERCTGLVLDGERTYRGLRGRPIHRMMRSSAAWAYQLHPEVMLRIHDVLRKLVEPAGHQRRMRVLLGEALGAFEVVTGDPSSGFERLEEAAADAEELLDTEVAMEADIELYDHVVSVRALYALWWKDFEGARLWLDRRRAPSLRLQKLVQLADPSRPLPSEVRAVLPFPESVQTDVIAALLTPPAEAGMEADVLALLGARMGGQPRRDRVTIRIQGNPFELSRYAPWLSAHLTEVAPVEAERVREAMNALKAALYRPHESVLLRLLRDLS